MQSSQVFFAAASDTCVFDLVVRLSFFSLLLREFVDTVSSHVCLLFSLVLVSCVLCNEKIENLQPSSVSCMCNHMCLHAHRSLRSPVRGGPSFPLCPRMPSGRLGVCLPKRYCSYFLLNYHITVWWVKKKKIQTKMKARYITSSFLVISHQALWYQPWSFHWELIKKRGAHCPAVNTCCADEIPY